MNDIIRRIRRIIGNYESSELSITVYSDGSIVFDIYEQKIPIMIDLKKEKAYVNCECINTTLTSDNLIELGKICAMLDKNMESIKSIFEL